MFDSEYETEENKEDVLNKLRTRYIAITIVLMIISAVFASEYTLYYYNKNLNLEKIESSEEAKENINAISANLKNFRKLIDTYYLGEIDEQKIFDETIKGYINGLGDEYSQYLTSEDWKDFQASALGNYVGIGIYMGMDKNNNVLVISIIEGTPAEKAGLQQGDIIVSVDDKDVSGYSTEAVASLIKGDEKTNVKLKILRANEYLEFDIKRDFIKVYHVKSKLLEGNIGYISLYAFDEGCSEEFKNEYVKIKSQGSKKLIIDLRNNTGGLVDEALKILDLIIPKGEIELITVNGEGKKDYNYAKGNNIIDCEIVVLVNEYSASASEITVGALKDSGKAKVVGVTTYGKGVIQSIFELKDGSALKLTTSEYLTPKETKINKVGIEPDYVVELNSETEEDEQLNKAIELLK